MNNTDKKTVESFGDEWSRFDQSGMSLEESEKVFKEYFDIFPWNEITNESEGFDMGCGSGRWARFVAPKVKKLNCIDPSNAINVAQDTLSDFNNINFERAGVDNASLKENSQDFGYSLGVLHHIPITSSAIKSCVNYLKPGSPLLLYLYYKFDNRPLWYKALWKFSDFIRIFICRLPSIIKHLVTNLIALLIYLPFARLAKLFSWLGVNTKSFPLSYYKDHSFYTMKTDSRDRFGTPLEQRFKKQEIEEMMIAAGLENITFSDNAPYWCVIGNKK
jgi:SAM-dependent methyltransferase